MLSSVVDPSAVADTVAAADDTDGDEARAADVVTGVAKEVAAAAAAAAKVTDGPDVVAAAVAVVDVPPVCEVTVVGVLERDREMIGMALPAGVFDRERGYGGERLRDGEDRE